MTSLLAPLDPWTFRNIIVATFVALEGNLANWLEVWQPLALGLDSRKVIANSLSSLSLCLSLSYVQVGYLELTNHVQA